MEVNYVVASLMNTLNYRPVFGRVRRAAWSPRTVRTRFMFAVISRAVLVSVADAEGGDTASAGTKRSLDEGEIDLTRRKYGGNTLHVFDNLRVLAGVHPLPVKELGLTAIINLEY